MAKITPEIAQQILERLQRGDTTLLGESRALGFTHNGRLRTALRKLIGNEKYNELMTGRRGRPRYLNSEEPLP